MKNKKDLVIKTCKPRKGIDWNGIRGFSKEMKNRDNPRGHCLDIIWEGSNKMLRIYAPKYRYLDVKETLKMLSIITKATQQTIEKHWRTI